MIEKNFISGIVVFLLLLSLPLFIYNQFQNTYGFTSSQETSLIEELKDITLLNGFEEIQKVVKTLANFKFDGNVLLTSFEVMRGATFGILQLIIGLVTVPLEVVSVTCLSFGLPAVFSNLVGITVEIYILMMLYSLMKGG